jgi:hypothetical protein
MKTSQFEAVKVAIKQDKTGYVLTLSIHPDEIPDEVLRDFVGARYQVVMVRLNGEEKPMNRSHEYAYDPVRLAGMLCRDTEFHRFLLATGNILEVSEKEVADWMRSEFGVASRSELRDNPDAAKHLHTINEEYKLWKLGA